MKAFPHIEIKHTEPPGTTKKIYHRGLDLRDYFAAKAMQALLTKQAFFDHKKTGTAVSAYIVADAMMGARNETNR